MRGNQLTKIAVVNKNNVEHYAVTTYAGGNISKSVRK